VHSIDEARARLAVLDRPAGNIDRDLVFGIETIRFSGLSAAFAAALEARWGGFFTAAAADKPPSIVVRTVRGDGSVWLPRWRPGEGYRLEADAEGGPLVVRSYHFALGPEIAGPWRLAVLEQPDEPLGRVFDNAARYLVARLALERGGLALHGAGVLKDGKAWIFAGSSGAGKSTAARLSAPAASLGDDFAVILPQEGGWAAPALPFDNTEIAPRVGARGLLPLAGIVRLFQAPTHSVETPAGVLAQASLMSCAAFPWALPDLSEAAGEAVAQIAASGLYRHLRFAPDPGFWSLLTDNR
jgi:hypothetical protein